jgi:serine/threonine protein kinase
MKIIDFVSLVGVYRHSHMDAETVRANLLREVDVLSRLCHCNIVHLEEWFWADAKLYIVMELVEGKDLLDVIPPGGLQEAEAKDFFFQLCSAVAYCHANSVRISFFLDSVFFVFSF